MPAGSGLATPALNDEDKVKDENLIIIEFEK